MANILKRFGDIMSANINALLDKAEDPEKMIDQYLREIESDLGKVKAETAAVMAAETKAKRELDECAAEAEKMQKYAEKALLAACEEGEKAVSAALAAGDFDAACEALAGLRGPIDRFFTDVLVMDPDPTVRDNRLRLLNRFAGVFGDVADIGALSKRK